MNKFQHFAGLKIIPPARTSIKNYDSYFLVWLIVTTAWLLLLYCLYDYLVYIMIGIFCLFGASAMATVIYNFFLINFECTENITCPTRDVRRWKFCDFIPQLLCRSGFPVAGTHQKYFSKMGGLRLVSWICPEKQNWFPWWHFDFENALFFPSNSENG